VDSSGLQHVLDVVTRELPAAGIDFALVGGFAVNSYGYTRATLDLDFMITAGDLEAVREIMLKAGFSNFSRHEVVAFFSRPGAALRVDFLQVDAGTLQKVLGDAETIDIRGARVKIPSLPVLIAMKLFAVEHGGAARADKDLPDVAHLAVLNGLDPETDLRPICRRHASPDTYEELCRRIRQLQQD